MMLEIYNYVDGCDCPSCAREYARMETNENGPEPVAWRVDGTQCGQPAVFFYYKQSAMLQGHIDQGDKITPLYAAPMPEREGMREALVLARKEIERQLHKCGADEQAAQYFEGLLSQIDAALAPHDKTEG